MSEPLKRKPAFKPLLWLFLWFSLFGISVLVYYNTYEFNRRILLQHVQIAPAAKLLQAILPGEDIRRYEDSIYCSRAHIQVLRGCDGVEAWLLVATALLVYPMPWRRRLISMFYGTLLIFSLNLLRIVSLFLISMSRPHWLDFAHGIVWQSGMVLAAFIFVLYWLDPGSRQSGSGAT